jgi:hypothetical protein
VLCYVCILHSYLFRGLNSLQRRVLLLLQLLLLLLRRDQVTKAPCFPTPSLQQMHQRLALSWRTWGHT